MNARELHRPLRADRWYVDYRPLKVRGLGDEVESAERQLSLSVPSFAHLATLAAQTPIPTGLRLSLRSLIA